MPIYEYFCGTCQYRFDELVGEEVPKYIDCRCGEKAEKLFALPGGYQMNSGGSSTRPKNSGSKPSKKLNFKDNK